MKPRMLVPLILILFISFSAQTRAGQKEELALDAATQWLDLIDDEHYGDSWENAASLFKAAVAKAQWQQMLEASRSPLGDVIKREVTSIQYTASLPGAPDGEYVVIQFDAAFSHKTQAQETVTPMLDQDGTWRVSGYYVR